LGRSVYAAAVPLDRDDDELIAWSAHAEPGQTVERNIDGIGRFARNSENPGVEARRMARVGTIIIAATIGLVVVLVVVSATSAMW
jgi:hypothetical protein